MTFAIGRLLDSSKLGTAFAVSPTLVLTAFHCIGNEETGSVTNREVCISFPKTAKPVSAVYEKGDPRGDYAILRLQSPLPEGLEIVPLLLQARPYDPFRSGGYPPAIHKADLSWVDGTVTAIETTIFGGEPAIQLRCNQASAGLSLNGLSGAPVLLGEPEMAIGLVRCNPPNIHAPGLGIGGIVYACPIRSILDSQTWLEKEVELYTEAPGRRPTVWDGRIPYLGLESFRESDAEFFFGRESLVDELLRRVGRSPFVVLSGPSGSGKSSVARAGLFHALQQGRLARSKDWLLAAMRPAGDPLANLAAAVDRAAGRPGAGDHLRQHGSENAAVLRESAAVLLSDDPRQRFVLLVDQFEEIFTQTRDEATRLAFINLLTAAATGDGRTIVILALRSDFVSNCARYPELLEMLNKEFQLMGVMDASDLTAAITLPARKVGAEIDPDLVARIVTDMRGEPGSLPLMSFALRDLFEAEMTAKGRPMDMTLAEYLNRGGIERALQRHANHVFDNFTDEQKRLARTIFSRLVEVGQSPVVTRRTVTFEELVPAGTSPELVEATVAPLAGEGVRLITTSGERDVKGVMVTLAHERLIDAWPWLRELVEENRELIALQNRIQNDAIAWSEKQDVGDLYRGGRLVQVEERLEALRPNLDELSMQFIDASLEQREAEQQAEVERIRLNILKTLNKANQLAEASRAELPKNQELALLLAATGLGMSSESDNKLRFYEAARAPFRRSLYGHTAWVYSAVFSPDGQRIVTASGDNSAKVWDEQGNQLASLDGHTGGVNSAVFSPDGQRIVTASGDNSAKVWDGQGHELASLDGHMEGVNSAVFSPDGQRIVTASMDKSAKVWDLQGHELASLDGHTAWVNSAVFSPDGQRIVTASEDRSAKVWDVQGNQLASLDGHTAWVKSAVFSPDGQRIVTASGDNSAKVWDLQGHELASLDGHTCAVRSAVFSAVYSPDGQRIVTASADKSAKVWDAQGHELASLDGHTGWVISAVFSPDGQRIVTASEDKSAKVWDVQGNLLASLDGHTGGLDRRGLSETVFSAVFSPDGQRIVTASADQSAKVWDAQGHELASLDGHTVWVNSAVFSPDGQRIVTASADQSAKVWDVQGHELASLDGHAVEVYSAVFSPDGQWIVTASGDNSAKVWDVQGNLLASLDGHTAWVYSAVFSPDGQRIVTASGDNSAKVWDGQGHELASLDGHMEGVNSAVFSPDGQRIVTASMDKSAKVWDVQGNQLASLDGHMNEVTSAVFSPDGQRIVTASFDNSAKVWDVQGNLLSSLDGHAGGLYGGVYSAIFSPDGQRIVTASVDKSAKVWDLQGHELASLDGHTAWVNSAVFSPDGQRIVTASEDRSAKVWDVQGNQLASLDGHTAWVKSAVFSPDGQRIVTASGDMSARVWDVPPTIEGVIAIVKARLSRGFSEAECRRFFRDDPDSCPRTVEEVLSLFEGGLHQP